MHHLILIRNLLLYLFVGLFFIFPRLQPITFSLAFLLTLFTGEFKGNTKVIFLNKYFFLFCLFFLIYALSLTYSENKISAWAGIELMLSFLVFPIFLPLILNGGKIKPRRLLEFAFISAITSFFLCFFRAIYRYLSDFDLGHFFSSDFSFIVHPSYLSVVLNILLCIVLYRLIKSKKPSRRIWISITILVAYILLAASKIGLLLLFINALGTIVLFAVKHKQVLKTLLLCLGLVLGSFIVISYVPKINAKYTKAYEETFLKDYSKPTNKLSSTGQRIIAWKTTKLLIKENSFKGVGIGDLRTDLNQKYKETGYELMYKKGLDSHQQFLQTWATTGIGGFILLILIFTLIIIDALKNKDYLLFSFGLFFLLFGLTESMLATQAGVLSFLLFFYLLSNKTITRVLKSTL